MLTEGPPVHRTHTTVDSPVGPLTLVSADGVLSGLYLDRQRYRPPAEIFGEPDDTAFGQVMDQLAEYFAGKRNEFSVPVSLSGTRFQRTVWTALRDIPYGETISYGELAARIGRPLPHVRSAWPTARTRSASSCPAIASSALPATSPATAAA